MRARIVITDSNTGDYYFFVATVEDQVALDAILALEIDDFCSRAGITVERVIVQTTVLED